MNTVIKYKNRNESKIIKPSHKIGFGKKRFVGQNENFSELFFLRHQKFNSKQAAFLQFVRPNKLLYKTEFNKA